MKKNLIKCLAVGLAICLLLAGCATSPVASSSSAQPSATASAAPSASASAAVKPTTGGTMVFGLSTEPKNLEPYMDNGWAQKQIVQCIYRSFFDMNENGEAIPGLCDKYSVSSDGLTWTFHIIDATFQNGDKVTAEDLKFTIEYVRDTDSLGAYCTKDYKAAIKEVKVVDDKTIEVVTFKPFAPLRDYLAGYYSGVISKSWTQSHDMKTQPMGCGPFKFVSWERAQSIKLARFDKYAGQVAYLDGLEFNFYADENARVNALKTGVVDIIDYVPAQQFKAVEEAGLEVDRVEGPFMYMPLNCTVDPLSKAAVRKSLAYAISRDDVIKTAFNGEGTPIYGTPFTKTMVGYNDKYAKYYTFDQKKAKEMLTEAGYPNGFKFTLGCSSQYQFNEKTAVAVQGSLKNIGVEVTLDAYDWTTYWTKLLAREFQAGVNGTAGPFTDPAWMSSMYVTNNSFNVEKYSNPKFDELMAAAAAEMDKTKRAELYGQVQQLMLDDCPIIDLMWRIQAYAHKKSLKGFVNMPNGAFVQSATRFNYVYIQK